MKQRMDVVNEINLNSESHSLYATITEARIVSSGRLCLQNILGKILRFCSVDVEELTSVILTRPSLFSVP